LGKRTPRTGNKEHTREMKEAAKKRHEGQKYREKKKKLVASGEITVGEKERRGQKSGAGRQGRQSQIPEKRLLKPRNEK